MWLIGREFQIGKARFRGQYYCDPCLRPSRLSGKTQKFLEAFSDRGGLVAEIIESGLRLRQWVGTSALAREVVGFLARGPQPLEIVAYRPSQVAVERSRELLRRNQERSLTSVEEAELDEMALLDQLMTLIKAKAWEHASASS